MQRYAELGTTEEGTRNRWTDQPADRDGRTRTKKIESVVALSDFEAVHSALQSSGFDFSVSDVRTSSSGSVRRQYYRGTAYEVLVPKVKLEMLVPADRLSEALDVLVAATRQFSTDDSTVVVYDVCSALRVVHSEPQIRHRGAGSL